MISMQSKRGLIFAVIAVAIVLSTALAVNGEESYCDDLDDGDVYRSQGLYFGYTEYDGRYNKGMVSEDCAEYDSIVTSCTGVDKPCSVREAICDSNAYGGYNFKKIECTYGCSQGACLKEPQTASTAPIYTVITGTGKSKATAAPVLSPSIFVKTKKILSQPQPVQLKAVMPKIAGTEYQVTTDDYANQATAVPVDESTQEERIIVRTSTTTSQATAVPVVEPMQQRTQSGNLFGKAINVIPKETENRVDAAGYGLKQDVSDQEVTLTCNNECGMIYEIRGLLRTLRREAFEAINSLKNDLTATKNKQDALEERVSTIARQQLTEFLASCQSNTWASISDSAFRQRYGTCNRYCQEAEGKTCLASVGYYVDEREPYPIADMVGCSYQHNGQLYNKVRCICCSFSS